MKKLFLLISAGIVSVGAMAQYAHNNRSVLFNPSVSGTHATRQLSGQGEQHSINISNPNRLKNASGARTTGTGGSRWYSYQGIIDQLNGNAWSSAGTTHQQAWEPMWWDSTVTKRYSNGVFANELSGVAQKFDPAHYTPYNDTVTPFALGTDISVSDLDAYKVDSIAVTAAYIRRSGRPSSIVDTLVISIAPAFKYRHYTTAVWISNNPNVAPLSYVNMYSAAWADSLNRAAFSDSTAFPASVYKLPLDHTRFPSHLPDLTSHPGQEYDTTQGYVIETNASGGASIPAGMGFNATIAFKTGDTWTPNVDSVTKFNNFDAVFGYIGIPGTPDWMPDYNNSNPSYNDMQESSFLDSRGNGNGIPDFWIGEFEEQEANGPTGSRTWPFQYLLMDAHVTCATCNTIANDTTNHNPGYVMPTPGLISNVAAYPNPATEDVSVAFTLAHTSDVTVSLSNALGQLISTQRMGKITSGKALFNTSGLAEGVYFYSVEANGQRQVGRISVVH